MPEDAVPSASPWHNTLVLMETTMAVHLADDHDVKYIGPEVDQDGRPAYRPIWHCEKHMETVKPLRSLRGLEADRVTEATSPAGWNIGKSEKLVRKGHLSAAQIIGWMFTEKLGLRFERLWFGASR